MKPEGGGIELTPAENRRRLNALRAQEGGGKRRAGSVYDTARRRAAQKRKVR